MWEEPPVSGTRGSGTVFFAGCNLGCVFCQNKKISRSPSGRIYTEDELCDVMLRLESEGAHNVNLVTPTHYTESIVRVLEKVKPMLRVPVVWNSGGYESVETLRTLEGLVDVYLPDLKYFSPELSERYSSAPDYFEVAGAAVAEMYRQTGDAVFAEEDGIELIKKGVIVRHLLLPGCRKDSIRVVEALAGILPTDGVRLSLMRQFTPDFVDKEKYPELARRVTSFEYDSVVKRASELGFDGYTQAADSATAVYTHDFE
jgi:putative pyruvate formate lyase activating enzyme